MSTKFGTVVYEKPEPLISEPFEEAAKVARRHSLEELEAMRAGLLAEYKGLVVRCNRASVLAMISALLIFVPVVRGSAVSPTDAIPWFLFFSYLSVASLIFYDGYRRREGVNSQDSETIRMAIQMKTRKEEILALML